MFDVPNIHFAIAGCYNHTDSLMAGVPRIELGLMESKSIALTVTLYPNIKVHVYWEVHVVLDMHTSDT